jgi:hypothetical protein
MNEFMPFDQKEYVKNRIKETRRKLSAAKSRYKKLMAGIREKLGEENLKPGAVRQLWMSEATAIRNVKNYEDSLANLLDEAKRLGIDTGEGGLKA